MQVFFIDECGYLGASPDGIMVDTEGRPVRLVEVKCPFNAHNKTVKQAWKSFCCSLEQKYPSLKLDHEYYFQVQGQMAITLIHECDFFVWREEDIFIQTIPFDFVFWNNMCLPKLKHFFFYYMLLEITLYKNILHLMNTLAINPIYMSTFSVILV